MNIGERLQALRKQNGLSQEDLARQLAVTRQTISKWERSQSEPDLDSLTRLSEIFRVPADHLLRELPEEPEEAPEGPKRERKHLSRRGRAALLAAVSVLALAAIYICLVCDYFTAGRLSWSLIVGASILAAWAVVVPCLSAREGRLRRVLAAATVVPVPLLATLALLLERPVIFSLGVCLTLLADAAIWGVYAVFCRFRAQRWRAAGLSLLIFSPLPVIVPLLASIFLPQVQFDFRPGIANSGAVFLLALGCLMWRHLRRRDE